MAEDNLASGWGEDSTVMTEQSTAGEGLGDFSMDELVAAGVPVPHNFAEAYDGFDMEDDSLSSSTVGISKKQWAILIVMHLPLVVLWMYAILGVFERASIAVRWFGKMCGFTTSEEAFEDDDMETRRLVAGEYQHPGGRRTARPLPDELPYVCVQLPMYNDPSVARRVIDAACLLRWPRDLLEIQVLDDSDDARCKQIVDTCAATWRERGLMCNVVRRTHRRGFKSGALEAGRKKTAADLITVFDSDFVPPADYLERVVPHFYGNDGRPVDDMAMVQARWGFLNYDDSVLTMAQSMRLEAHRAAGGALLSKAVGCVVAAGAGATWSARAVTAAGGWDATALLESTDLALRAYCVGYKSKFLAHTTVLTELPGTFAAYKGQQERWAQGWAQMMKRHALPVLQMHGRPLWQRLYLFSAVVRESMWPVAFTWMLVLPVLIRKGHGWWLGAENIMPRAAALFLYAAPPALLFAADAVSAAALPPAPPLLMKRSHVAALRLLWLIPHIIVQTGMVVAHAAAFTLGVVSPRVEFSRTPKAGGGEFYRVDLERSAVVSEPSVIVSTSNDLPPVEGSNSGPTTPTKRRDGATSGHEFETNITACGIRDRGALPSIPGTPPRPVANTDSEGQGDRLNTDNAGPSTSSENLNGSHFIPAGGAERTAENASRRWTWFAMELTVTAAVFRLSFAAAATDGWHEPAVICIFIAPCILHVACKNWDDKWGRARRSRSPRARDADGETLLEPGAGSDSYGGLDGDGHSTMRGGVYDHVRRRQASADGEFGNNAGFQDTNSRDPTTRAAIRQYKRYRAKDFDLDNISVRSADSDAYSAGGAAFGGRNGRNGEIGEGSEYGESEAGYSETTARSELSAAVFAHPPPVLLTAAQLQTHYAAPPGSTRGPSRAPSEY